MSGLINQKQWKKKGNESLLAAEKSIRSDDNLKEHFLKCSVDSPLPKMQQLELCEELWCKTLHARCKAKTKRCKLENCSRHAKKGDDQNFRPDLASKTRKKTLQRAIQSEAKVGEGMKKKEKRHEHTTQQRMA